MVDEWKKHRTDGPAVELANGTKFWCLNDICHREDGPAIEFNNGDKSWYLNGVKYTQKAFNKLTQKKVFCLLSLELDVLSAGQNKFKK